MRALLINAVCGIRSTGRICTDIAKNLEDQGYEVKIAYVSGMKSGDIVLKAKQQKGFI